MQVAPDAAVDVHVIETFAELLFAVHTDGDSAVFFNRLCEATCRLAAMDRAVVFLYDEPQRRVRVLGSHGIEIDAFRDTELDLESAPMAIAALREDRVIEATERFAELVPPEYAQLIERTRLVCTPVSAAGRWPGVIFSNRPVDRPLAPGERHLLWSFGKLAALAESARSATREHEHAKHLQERIDLARDIHDGAIQRLFGVSLALSGETLSDAERRRCGRRVQEALVELRAALQRPLGPTSRETHTTLVAEVARLAARYREPAVVLDAAPGVEVPAYLEPLAQSVLAEALRNAVTHAEPTSVRVSIRRVDGTFILEVVNDGVGPAPGGRSGMGLRLAAMEALQHGGIVDFGRGEAGEWRVRLLAPAEREP